MFNLWCCQSSWELLSASHHHAQGHLLPLLLSKNGGISIRMLDGKWKCIFKKKTSKGSDPAQHLKHLKHPRQHWRPPVCGGVIPQASVRERRRTERLPVRLDGCCQTSSISISPPQTAQGWRCVTPSPLHPSFFLSLLPLPASAVYFSYIK